MQRRSGLSDRSPADEIVENSELVSSLISTFSSDQDKWQAIDDKLGTARTVSEKARNRATGTMRDATSVVNPLAALFNEALKAMRESTNRFF